MTGNFDVPRMVMKFKPKFSLNSTNQRGSAALTTETDTQGLRGAREWIVARLILSESRSAEDLQTPDQLLRRHLMSFKANSSLTGDGRRYQNCQKNSTVKKRGHQYWVRSVK